MMRAWLVILVLAVSAGPALSDGPVNWPTGGWHICGDREKRVTCVVDGDTIWWNGIEGRFKKIDTPEIKGRCARERRLAQIATEALVDLLNEGVTNIDVDGEDRYGRKIIEVTTHRGDVGPNLIKGGYAMPYGDRDKQKWCR